MNVADLLHHLSEARGVVSDDAPVLAIYRNESVPEDHEDAVSDVPIVSLSREDESGELNLVTSETGQRPTLTLGQLQSELQPLLSECAALKICVRGRYQRLEDDWWFWEDSPVVGWAVNPDEPAFGLVAWFEGHEDFT